MYFLSFGDILEALPRNSDVQLRLRKLRGDALIILIFPCGFCHKKGGETEVFCFVRPIVLEFDTIIR